MITKNLLPKCVKGQDTQQAKLNSWAKMEKEEQFIDSIDTSGGELSDSAKFNLLVSSVPSPWSRVHLTSHAIQSDTSGDSRTLMQFYDFMRSEWRGLVAAYVLYPEYFELSVPVELVSKDMAGRKGEFDIISTYAEMLFEDASLWKYEKGGEDTPKLQLLYYVNDTERQLVGATSPFSIFFTGVNYKVTRDEERIFWITEGGKFQDPLDISFESYWKTGEAKYNEKHRNNLKKLYSFLTNVQVNRKRYLEILEGIWDSEHEDDPSITSDSRCSFVNNVLDKAMGQWMYDLEKALDMGENDKSAKLPVHFPLPQGPLGKLLFFKTVYYWANNAFHTRILEGDNYQTIDDIERMFIDSNYLAVWEDNANEVTTAQGTRAGYKDHDYRQSPVHLLLVEENGEAWFVAMPLSPFALDDVFGNEFSAIVTGKNDNVKLVAEKHGDKVDVYLRARIDGEGPLVTIRNRSYNIVTPDDRKKVFLWPNFSSEKWRMYYYYSEFPINGPGVQMEPVFEGKSSFNELCQSSDRSSFARLIKYPETATTGDHVYEIIRTDTRLKRIAIRKRIGSVMEDLGNLVVRTTETNVVPGEPQAMRIIGNSAELGKATVGFDFGSTNSCAYYQEKGKEGVINPVPFANHRLPIIGFDNKAGDTAGHDELLFISNEEPINGNGQIKSWLHEHDEKYVNPAHMDEELVGGVPVNETNINVLGMDAFEIMTQAGRLRYNMKWLVDNVGKQRKQAFVKMVWIHICADLFEKGLYPATLNWSYPSAMGATDMQALDTIFKGLPSPTPKYRLAEEGGRKSFTEAEAVCSYFMDKKDSAEPYNIFLGIDIGGSTSDILIFGNNRGLVKSNQPSAATTQGMATVQQGYAPQQMYAQQQVVQQTVNTVPPLPNVSYHVAINGADAGEFTLQQMRDMKNAGQLSADTLVYRAGMVEWTPAGRVQELNTLFAAAVPPVPGVPPIPGVPPVPGPGLPPIGGGLPPVQPLPNVQYYAYLNGQPTGPFNAQQLLDLKNSGQLTPMTQVCTQGMSYWPQAGQVQELAFLFAAPVQPVGIGGLPPINNPGTAQPIAQPVVQANGEPVREPVTLEAFRLYTQCSVRMAAGMFFDAIINSKRFRDCIKQFHDSHQTNIRVEGIYKMDEDPKRAPYYLNNIFDQLHGDEEFTRFYTYLYNNVPFVFALPAYITGVLMAYAGMLMRKTIVSQYLKDIEEIIFRYFGKGGRLFEWLFFAFDKGQIRSYLEACFEVGLKSEQINKFFGRNENQAFKFFFRNVEDTDYGHSMNSENKSEVAYGLVSEHTDIAGITPILNFDFSSKKKKNTNDENDARKQEVIGEMGVVRNGKEMDELDYVDDYFYQNTGEITMPRNFENFSEFMEVFTKFLSQVYPNANKLKQRAEEVKNVKNFVMKDQEYRKYQESIRQGNEDTYRMPVFVAEALYYLQEVLLKEVFKE